MPTPPSPTAPKTANSPEPIHAMIQPRRHLRRLLASIPVLAATATALLPITVAAQAARTPATAAIPAEVAEQPVTVRYYLLSLGAAIPDISTPGTAGGAALTVPNGSPSNVHHYRGPRLMSFYEAGTATTAAGAATADTAEGNGTATATPATAQATPSPQQPPLAQVLLPANASSVLLLFAPDSNGQQMQIAAMPLNEQQFTGGSLLFQNFTQSPIAVNIGKQTLSLQPMLGSIYHHKGGNSREEGIVRMAKLNKEGKPALFYQSRWSLLPQRRTWVFFLPGADEGKVNIRRFYDLP